MKKAVMMSTHPRWCQLIENGEKKIEIRRTAPLLKPPFVVYLYCTKNHDANDLLQLHDWGAGKFFTQNCKVIGAFSCDKIECVKGLPDIPWSDPNGERELRICKDSCLTFDEIAKYGEGSNLWAWHLTELDIYSPPKELSKFEKYGGYTLIHNCIKKSAGRCNHGLGVLGNYVGCEKARLTRPPQSWCYVEEL